MNAAVLTVSDLTLQIAAQRLCTQLSFTVSRGQCWGLLGRNGAGKTTLLHSLLGVHKPHAGKLELSGRALSDIPRRELAREVGILLQDGMGTLPTTVQETVMLGRHPHSQSLLVDSDADRAVAAEVLQQLDLEHLAQRPIDTLSGGEKQRLALATLLAQAPNLYLLDEPSNHLDVAFQLRLLQVLQDTVRQRGAAMLMATHDINLAARCCDHIVLLLPEGKSIVGETGEVLTTENLSAAFACQIKSVSDESLTLFYPS